MHLSAYGLREGLIFDGMTAELKQADPLVAAAEVMARRPGNPEGLGEALQRWLQEPFEQLDPVLPPVRERTVRAAACRLADLGARLLPDHRASIVFEQVLRGSVILSGPSSRSVCFIATPPMAPPQRPR